MKSQDSEDESQPGGLDERLYRATFHETVYNGQPISWRYWIEQMPALKPAQAVRLLVGLDPDVFDDLTARPNTNNPARLCEQAAKMARLAEAEHLGTARPTEWLDWASQRGFRVHDGFRLALETASNSPSGASNFKPLAPPKAVQRPVAQEEAILAKLVELRYTPSALPRPPRGKVSAPKQEVRAALRFSKDVMNKAWVRLSKDGRIKYA